MVTLSLLIRLKGKRNFDEVYFIFDCINFTIYVLLVIVYIIYSFYLIY